MVKLIVVFVQYHNRENSKWSNLKLYLDNIIQEKSRCSNIKVALGHWAISSGKVKVSQLSHSDVLSYGKSSVAEGAITHVIT